MNRKNFSLAIILLAFIFSSGCAFFSKTADKDEWYGVMTDRDYARHQGNNQALYEEKYLFEVNKQALANGQVIPIPVSSIEKEPSAELRPGQKDSDSLPEYQLLDQILLRYVDQDQGSAALIEQGFDRPLVERVIAMVDKAEYKRRQYPPGTKVSSRAFGKDRRLPITSRWNESNGK